MGGRSASGITTTTPDARSARPGHTGAGRRVRHSLLGAGSALMLLAGCMQPLSLTSRSAFADASAPQGPVARQSTSSQGSDLIADLQSRRTVLPAQGPFRSVANSVLAGSASAAEADLRVARLTAKAQAKNWLPTVGPNFSLSSLGNVASSLLIDQVIFDNGRKKAERAYAAADVEVAAVSLSQEMNDRVYTGLQLYVTALKSRDQAASDMAAVGRMQEYNRIMGERVKGGLSDESEARVIRQKLAEMQARQGSDNDAATLARNQLNAMAGWPLDQVTGLDEVSIPSAAPEPLKVKLSESEGMRTVAQARITRAAYLPGISAQSDVGGGKPRLGLVVGTQQMLGLGTLDTLAALDASQEAADARAKVAREEADRAIGTLQGKLTALMAQQARSTDVTRQTRDSLDMFTEQYRAGRRTLMELVTMYETYAQMQRDEVGLKYDIALIKLEIARQRGILVDGASI
jgi:outer membrane protein, adhesin transport system